MESRAWRLTPEERSWIGEITDEGDLRVADGELGRGGEALTRGTEWVRDVFNTQGDGGAATHLALDLEDALDVNRMLVDPRAIALIVGRMLSSVRVYPSDDRNCPAGFPVASSKATRGRGSARNAPRIRLCAASLGGGTPAGSPADGPDAEAR